MDARSIEILTSSFWPILKAGISFTIPLTLISFALGTTLAVFVAIIRISKVPVLNKICELYVWIIRGTPLLVQLFLVFFGLPKVGVVINPMPSGILVFTLSIGAYSSEIIRAAILSIPKGQWEAAMSLGMSYPQQLLRIILPQAFKISVPPLFNSFIALVKDTSLAANITIPEMFLTTQRITARNYEPLLMYIEVGFIYLIFCTVLNYVQNRIENKLMLTPTDKKKIKEITAESLGADAGTITEETSFKEDLGADSLDLFEMVMAFEEAFEVEIPSEDLEQIQTVGDVVKYLEAHK